MSEKITIKNECLTVTADRLGAEMVSIKKSGREMLWCGDASVWEGHAPVLFPICGGLKDGKFLYNGREYFLEKHGYARHSTFGVEKTADNEVVFLLKSDEKSKNVYPFDYEFRVSYILDGNRIKVTFSIANTGVGEMYYSVGAHEAYACPGGIENYSIIFDEPEELASNLVEDGILSRKTVCIGKNTQKLPLKNEYFKIDALIFCGLKSRRVRLEKNSGETVAEVDFNGADYLLLWTIPGAEYLCIEPWCGLPDFTDGDYDIRNKPGIITVKPGETKTRTHTITF